MINTEERRLYEADLDMFPTTNENVEDIEHENNCEHKKTIMDKLKATPIETLFKIR